MVKLAFSFGELHKMIIIHGWCYGRRQWYGHYNKNKRVFNLSVENTWIVFVIWRVRRTSLISLPKTVSVFSTDGWDMRFFLLFYYILYIRCRLDKLLYVYTCNYFLQENRASYVISIQRSHSRRSYRNKP